jgi:hypothetical protein
VCDRFEVTDGAGKLLLVGEGCVARDLEVKLA